MIDATHLFVLESGSEVYSEHHGKQEANRVAVIDYHSEYWFPSEENPQTYPAYKARGENGKIYLKESDVQYIVDLTDDELRPVSRE